MKKNKTSLDVKLNALSAISYVDIENISNEDMDTAFTRFEKLIKDSAVTENIILDFVGITFVIEALILSVQMRDERLTNLDQSQVESLAFNLYLTLEKEHSEGGGYMQLCDASDHIIDRHLSNIPNP